jgi:hypothetical protein
VLCARAAHDPEGGELQEEFNDWAAGWLAGQDESGVNARTLADELEHEAQLETGFTQPVELMLANAARSASHASKLPWLSGRARDEENTLAIAYASEAVHTALRMAQLDVLALAEQAVPQQVAPTRPLSNPSSLRILKALPT